MSLFEGVIKHVKPRNVHFDKKSKEQTTGITRRKYKLAGKPIRELDQFIFFILAGSPGAYHKKLTVRVGQSEWLNRVPNRLEGVSHIDITRYEVLSSRRVGLKLVERGNRFRCVAELPEVKFLELHDKLTKLRSLRKPVPRETKLTIAKALGSVTPDIMRKLGL